MMTKKNDKIIGVSAAVGVAFFQSFESLFWPLFGLIFSVAFIKSPTFATASMALKETFSLIILLLCSNPKTLVNVFKKIKCKQGLYFLIAAGIGTTFGNLSFILAVLYAGSGYGVILTALYPVITILLINFVFKEKENFKVWIGVVLTIISAAMFVILPSIVENENLSWEKILGMLLGGAAALFWSIEGLFINRGIRGEIHFKNREVMATRSFITAFMSIVFILPISLAFKNDSYQNVDKIMSNWKSIILIIIIALNIFLLRITSIFAIRKVGAKITSIIDTNNFIIPSVLAVILAQISGEIGHTYQQQTIVWWSFFIIIPILIGVFISVYFQKPFSSEKNKLHT